MFVVAFIRCLLFVEFSTGIKVRKPQTALTTPAGWLLLLQLTVLNRSSIANEVYGGVVVLFIGCSVFCWYSGSPHRNESYLVLFLKTIRRIPCRKSSSQHVLHVCLSYKEDFRKVTILKKI